MNRFYADLETANATLFAWNETLVSNERSLKKKNRNQEEKIVSLTDNVTYLRSQKAAFVERNDELVKRNASLYETVDSLRKKSQIDDEVKANLRHWNKAFRKRNVALVEGNASLTEQNDALIRGNATLAEEKDLLRKESERKTTLNCTLQNAVLRMRKEINSLVLDESDLHHKKNNAGIPFVIYYCVNK